MKILLFSILAICLCFSVAFAIQPDAEKNVIRIMSGTTIAANGTSTYVIDTNSSQFGYRPTGEFSLQFKGFKHAELGGATINAYWRGCNTLPTGVTSIGLIPKYQVPKSKMASTTIVSGLNLLSGNTEYVYGFFTIDATRYILVDITAGVSSVGVTAYVKVD